MPLPIGNWTVTAGNNQGTLSITAVTPGGIVAGAIELSGAPGGNISSSFNESTQELSFIAVTGATSTNVRSFSYYHAILFSCKLKSSTANILAGEFMYTF